MVGLNQGRRYVPRGCWGRRNYVDGAMMGAALRDQGFGSVSGSTKEGKFGIGFGGSGVCLCLCECCCCLRIRFVCWNDGLLDWFIVVVSSNRTALNW